MITIEHMQMTVGDLTRHVESRTEPVRRSTHVGNQPAKELVIMGGLPKGVDILMVDTVQGNDKYTRPNMLIGAHVTKQLLSNNKARGRVVGALTVDDAHPEAGRSIVDIHQRALDQLPLINKPTPMMRFFSQYPDLLEATMSACISSGEATRRVDESGRIHTINTSQPETIYGHNATTGSLLPLNGMMVMDMLISEAQGSDSTLHIGGRDMVQYTRDIERIEQLSDLFAKTCAVLGVKRQRHAYRIVNGKNLALVDTPSQHALLETQTPIDISAMHHIELGDV